MTKIITGLALLGALTLGVADDVQTDTDAVDTTTETITVETETTTDATTQTETTQEQIAKMNALKKRFAQMSPEEQEAALKDMPAQMQERIQTQMQTRTGSTEHSADEMQMQNSAEMVQEQRMNQHQVGSQLEHAVSEGTTMGGGFLPHR